MRYWYLLTVSFLLVACQPSQPSKIEQYNKAKTKANQHLELEFKHSIEAQITNESKQVIDASDFVVSKKVVQELENALASVGQSVETAEEHKNTIPTIDSIGRTATTSFIEKKPNNGAMLLNVRNYQDTYNNVQKLSKKYAFNIVNELEQTGDFYKGNTMEIYITPENFETVLSEFRDLAVVIRQKQVWQQKEKKDYLPIISQIKTTQAHLASLDRQLEKSTVLEDQLKLKDKISAALQELNLAKLNAASILSNPAYSTFTLAFYQNLEMAKPKAATFSAGFSSNLVIGWAGFKQFILDAALVWPYIIIGLLFLGIVLLAVGNSRKKSRQFKLQMLHGQTLQQQKMVQPIRPITTSKN
ncbi:MAG: Unknown protein [uncultured Aureispira sp.]|uniref:DUF4349 domain-containing protein n=1 Tax=uncultured Aureispira sp. TaxID=1331704 RepID=A0A6S6TLI0_9BACT|nr:MAG: Unknown protein [uncultured Aureispira sp.]